MADTRRQILQCVVISPRGTLVNCSAASLVFPAHDGYVGVLRDHTPMFCRLGLGLMRIAPAPTSDVPSPTNITLLIDDGFALISSNLVTIIAGQAISRPHVRDEKIRQMAEKIRKGLADGLCPADQRQHETNKASLLETLLAS